MKRRILLVGSARTELALHTDAFAADGETRFGAFTGNTVPGGPLSYAGVAVTRLGGEAILCSAVGDDQYGRDLVKFYEDLGMDTRFVKTVRGGASPLGVTAERADGERRSYRSTVLSEAIDCDLVEEAFTSLPDAVWLSLEIPVSAAARVTELAREKKIPVFADGEHIPADFRLMRSATSRWLHSAQRRQALHRHRAALGAEQSRGGGRAGEDHPCGNLYVPRRGGRRRLRSRAISPIISPMSRGRMRG